jgi:hypothetical protein
VCVHHGFPKRQPCFEKVRLHFLSRSKTIPKGFIMKFRFVAIAAACAAISGQANALTVAQSQAAQLKLFISGSSALQRVIEGILTQNCGAGTLTQFRGLSTSAAGGTNDTSNGQSNNIYSCTITGSDFGAANVGKTIMLVKREAGGSAQGVFPVASNANVNFMDISTCTDGANTCTGLVATKPDAGVSDLEPTAFNNSVNRPTAFNGQSVTNSQYATGTPRAVAEQVFGLVVNDQLYADLQTDQGLASTDVPSVSSSAFTSLYSGGYLGSGLGWTPLLTNNTGTRLQSQINICSRGLGSGTRATAQIHFLQSPNNVVPVAFGVPVVENTATAIGSTTGAYFISEESSSGNVVSCVNKANAAAVNGYAIGLVSADRDLTGTGAKFVKLDNQLPSSSVAKIGKYQWVFEAFYQVNKLAPNLAIAQAFGTAFANPANIAAITATGVLNGIMATPENCAAASSTSAVCSRVSRNQDSRTPLVFIN